MATVQRLLGQDEGRRYIHYILSFDKGVNIDDAYSVCKEAASYYGDYQYLLAVHQNTRNLHMHVILSAVNVQTGKKFSQSKGGLQDFKDYVNSILERYGLNPVKNISEVDWTDEMEMAEDGDIGELFLFDIDYPNEVNDCGGCFDYDESYGNEEEDWWYDEEKQIEEAESQSRLLKAVIAFFEGRREDLPEEISFEDAEIMYWQWADSQYSYEE